MRSASSRAPASPPPPRLPSQALRLGLVASLFVAFGCGDDAPSNGTDSKCATIDTATCKPLFSPTYDKVFERVLVESCADGGDACHGTADGAGAEGGLHVDPSDPGGTHSRLLEHGFARPNDAACSPLVARILTSNPAERMPPGGTVDPGATCALAQWIQSGAAQ